MTNFARLVPAPEPSSINHYCNPARVSTMRALLGSPGGPLGQDCRNSQASEPVARLLVTRRVGPFRVTGIRPFVELLSRVFRRVEQQDPALYAAVGSNGVLCVRYVRGSTLDLSNHAWGTALDVTFLNPKSGKQETDLPLGNGVVQTGCLRLYDFFRQEGETSGEWAFWGAGFSREDGMHFEASDELIRMWSNQGRL